MKSFQHHFKHVLRESIDTVIEENYAESIITLDTKFDVVVGNPPYNDASSQRDTTNHRQGGRNLFKEFLYLCMNCSKEHVVVVGPASKRVYNDATRDDLKSKGLWEVKDVGRKYFPDVSLPLIATYAVDMTGNKKGLSDCTNKRTPKDNLGCIFTTSAGKLPREKYEHNLKDSGKCRVFVTTNITKYTSDDALINKLADPNRDKVRVVLNGVASRDSVGKMKIAVPGDIVGASCNTLICTSVAQAKKIIKYLESDAAKKVLKRTRIGVGNTKRNFEAYPMP